jgi:hypothetical protein
MPAIRHRTVVVDGLNVFVREAGLPGNPPVLLLPGYPSRTRAHVEGFGLVRLRCPRGGPTLTQAKRPLTVSSGSPTPRQQWQAGARNPEHIDPSRRSLISWSSIFPAAPTT